MYTTYHLHANELDNSFIESLKKLFKDKTIEIIVSEVDETAYLLQSEANKKRLLQAIQNVDNQQNLVPVLLDEESWSRL
jgi:antitoxin YefM